MHFKQMTIEEFNAEIYRHDKIHNEIFPICFGIVVIVTLFFTCFGKC